MPPKVFCIGFNKTGTTTLHRTFIQMRFRSLHGDFNASRPLYAGNVSPFPSNALLRRRLLEIWRTGKTWTLANVGCLHDQYDCFSDGELHDFRRLHQQFPTAKFILNTRALDRWIVSRLGHIRKIRAAQRRWMLHNSACVVHWRRRLLRRLGAAGPLDGGIEPRRPEEACTRYMAPCHYDDTDSAVAFWVERRRNYHRDVLDFFRGREDLLLVVDVEADPGYLTQLTSFLGVPGYSGSPIHASTGKMTDRDRSELLARAHRVLGRLGINSTDFGSPLLP